MSIDNHRLEKSRSQRILWLLEELKVPYELEIFHRNKETHLAPPELKKIHGKPYFLPRALELSQELFMLLS
jgi:glutathione S-transferase